MGCTTSANYPPDKTDFKKIIHDEDVSSTGNLHTNRTAVVIARHSDSKSKPIVCFSEGDEAQTDAGILRGDVMQKHHAKLTRQKNLLEKQTRVALAAERLAQQVLEEERLSLTSRSRGTSRATSRTGSPTATRKPIAFKPDSGVDSGSGRSNCKTDNSQLAMRFNS